MLSRSFVLGYVANVALSFDRSELVAAHDAWQAGCLFLGWSMGYMGSDLVDERPAWVS